MIGSLERLRPFQNIGHTSTPRGLNKYRYKVLRSMVHREEVTIELLEGLAK